MSLRPHLPDLTLCAISSVAIAQTARAMALSVEQANFGELLWVSDQPCPLALPKLRWVQIPPIASRSDYSRYVLRELADHVQTSHLVLVQWDGYVLDGSAWDDAFLQMDYIGAVWPQFPAESSVGNGGFSMRSKRLLEMSATLPVAPDRPEDLAICHDMRHTLEKAGMRFAPPQLAHRFSYERLTRDCTFGFHGIFNMPRLMNPSAFRAFFEALEPRVIGDREQLDLLDIGLQGFTHDDRKLALSVLRRIWSEQPMRPLSWKALWRIVSTRLGA